MSERKVISKYYPPDFDPDAIAKRPRKSKAERSKPKLAESRIMLPMSIQCTRCGEYIYKGKKFNAKKEDSNERYLGIKIWRFYFKCTQCLQEISFKTDPQNSDYTVERGARRNFEPWKAKAAEEEQLIAERKSEDMDRMKALENRTSDNRREMEILDALEELRELNARISNVDTDHLIELRHKNDVDSKQMMEQEDAEIARHAFEQQFKKRVREEAELETKDNNFDNTVKDIELHADGADVTDSLPNASAQKHAESSTTTNVISPHIPLNRPMLVVVAKKQKTEQPNSLHSSIPKSAAQSTSNQTALGVLAAYGSDSDTG